MAASNVFLFGIRHHGPGSAQKLKRALVQLQPDKIIIEAPQDAESMIPYIANPKLKPPVAVLIYNPKDLQQAVYLPFTSFSPEWIALQFALKNETPVAFFDLPMSHEFGMSTTDFVNLQKTYQSQINRHSAIEKDPLAYIAKLAGYNDAERWWEVTFERSHEELQLFSEIQELMTSLRGGQQGIENPLNLRREAYMRKILKKTIKEGFQNIAVVCGAWHVPALLNLNKYKAKQDNVLIKVTKKVKTRATWIPWTYERIAVSSGYGAGVVSPAWYELLYKKKGRVVEAWVVKAAQLLRKERIDVSPAHCTDTVILAKNLAALRSLEVAGIEELQESAITVLSEGNSAPLKLIERKLIIGDKVGNIPEEIPRVPLQEDLEQRIKATRLKKYLTTSETQFLKATAKNPRGGIDLREGSDLLKSQLLHQLDVIDIPFGSLQKAGKFDKGSFKEYWKLKWKPEYYIKVIELSQYGNTISEVAEVLLQKQTVSANTLATVIECIEITLACGITKILEVQLQKANELATTDQDLLNTISFVTKAIQIINYSNLRGLNLDQMNTIIQLLFEKICIHLPLECNDLENEVATEYILGIEKLNNSISLLEDALQERWMMALKKLNAQSNVSYQIFGFTSRILFDRTEIGEEELIRLFRYVFSFATAETKSVQWLEGFTRGTGLLLIYYPRLWQILDTWISDLEHEPFQENLPLLRKVFSKFSSVERQKMLLLSKSAELIQSNENQRYDFKDNPEIRATVSLLFGYN